MQAATLPPAGHKAGVTQTVKYSRFGANKKRGVFPRFAVGGKEVAGGARERKIEWFETKCAGRFAQGQSGHYDVDHSLARTWGWCAGGPPGYRRWRRSRARHGLFLAHGPAPGARNFAFHIVAACWSGSLARILEAGPGRLARRDFLRPGNALRSLRRKLDGFANILPALERIVRLLPATGWISALEKDAHRCERCRYRPGECSCLNR